MTNPQVATVLVIAAALLQSGGNLARGADPQVGIQLRETPGIAIPSKNELKAKIESRLRAPAGTKYYVRRGGVLVETEPPQLEKGIAVVVRSFDKKNGRAYVQLVFPKYEMPVVQIWNFDGKNWSDDVDPGLFAR